MRLNDEPNYRLNCGQYVLHFGDTPNGPVMDEVALAISRIDGILHKHGSIENVTAWANQARDRMRALGDPFGSEMAQDIIVLSGRFKLEEINRCLTTTGYVSVLLRKFESGQLEQEQLLPAPAKPRALGGGQAPN